MKFSHAKVNLVVGLRVERSVLLASVLLVPLEYKKWRPFQSPVRFTFILLPLAARSEVCSIHYQLSGVDRSEVLLASSGVGLTTIPTRFEANLSKLGC